MTAAGWAWSWTRYGKESGKTGAEQAGPLYSWLRMGHSIGKVLSRISMPNSKVSLLRQLGLVSATAIVISNMVGTGIFTTTGFLAGDLGDPTIVLAIWVAGAFCALAGAFCYSELGINFPSSGGEYVYLSEAWGPTWGFMDGWVSFVAGFSAPIALAALASASYLGYFFPELQNPNQGTHVGPFVLGGAQAVACTMIAAFTILNCFGLKLVSGIQNVLTAIKLAVVVGFIVFGLAIGKGDWSHFQQTAVRTSSNSIPEQFALSLLFIYLAYSGWNAATYVAEELQQPHRTLPLALTVGTMIVAALFVALNVVFIYAAPLEEMKGVVAVGSFAATRLFGPDIASLFSALMAMSLLATVNAMVTIGPRVYYAMAKNRAFFPQAAQVNERFRTPIFSIASQGLFAMIMCLTPFRDLMFFVGFLLNAFTVMAVASLFIFRKRPGWQKLPVVSFAWPLIPSFFIVVGAWVFYTGTRMNPRVSLAGFATVAVGALFYHFLLAPGVRRAHSSVV
jgi:APA family basic amino acid/polyamine antiporter